MRKVVFLAIAVFFLLTNVSHACVAPGTRLTKAVTMEVRKSGVLIIVDTLVLGWTTGSVFGWPPVQGAPTVHQRSNICNAGSGWVKPSSCGQTNLYQVWSAPDRGVRLDSTNDFTNGGKTVRVITSIFGSNNGSNQPSATCQIFGDAPFNYSCITR